MRISYNWLSKYLPEPVSAEKCAPILTAIGLEVEGIETTGIAPEKLEGLVVAEVLTCEKHPNADSLSLTTVWDGTDQWPIVCGAPNVAKGQKVVLARIGTILYPTGGESFKIKKAKIRGAESMGMLCSGDEIGLDNDHSGILVLPPDAKPGSPMLPFLSVDGDTIFEIGLTPNRTDAMSHYGVARDLCAYIAYHEERTFAPVFPSTTLSPSGNAPVTVQINNTTACTRYSGITLQNVKVQESPDWLKEKLLAIGLKPHNNIVDVTNFILHETGQPLHAFDADQIAGNKIIVQTLQEGTPFITLDDKERKLTASDLMICDTEKPLCIAGVYGGINSGVTGATKRIFLESATFSPEYIRRTSLHHGLRTDAAARYEKGADATITVKVLLRAAELMCELSGAQTNGAVVDVYPSPLVPVSINLTREYLHRISGKVYDANKVKSLLQNLGYDVKENDNGWQVAVPGHKPQVKIAAEVVQEIMRIDGLDNIPFPQTLSISPGVETGYAERKRLGIARQHLTHSGFYEIFTNSLTNSNWYNETVLQNAVKMKNALSREMDTLRPQMLPGGLNCIAYNLNRKNDQLRFYEFGKTYFRHANGYAETNRLCLYLSGMLPDDWRNKTEPANLFYLKGVLNNLFAFLGITANYVPASGEDLDPLLEIRCGKKTVGVLGGVKKGTLKRFDIDQPVFMADLDWDALLQFAGSAVIYKEIPKFPSASRDLSIVVNKALPFAEVEKATRMANIGKLAKMELFDVFENEKLGADKKSLAISYTFIDEERTLTDAEMDKMVAQLVQRYEKDLMAEIRS